MDKSCFSWVQIIKKDTSLSFHAKAIALYLSTYMNLEHDTAWPSQKRISSELNISKPTIIKYLKELELSGYLVILKKKDLSKGGEQYFNCYQANIPQKVVNVVNPLDEGGKSQSQRGLTSEPKGVNHVNPNNNLNNKYNNNTSSDESQSNDNPDKFNEIDLLNAEYLYNSILKFNPNHKKPNLKTWAAEIRKLREADKRDPKDIRVLIDYAHSEDFWRCNLLSPKKLRKHWDRLTIQRNQQCAAEIYDDGLLETAL